MAIHKTIINAYKSYGIHIKLSNKPLDEIKRLMSLTEKFPRNIENFKETPYNITLKEAIKESEEFMKSHFRLQYIYCIKNYDSIEEIINIVTNSDNACDPYKIPILENNEYRSTTDCSYIGFNNRIWTFYKKIGIQNNFTEFTSSAVTHEITHTQQGLEQGVLNYYNNIEFLPILLEMFHYMEKFSFNEHLIERTFLRRFKMLIQDIYSLPLQRFLNDEDNIITLNQYIESTLKAIGFAEIYQNSSESIKKEIFGNIQNIFSANKSVEDLLNKYNISFDSSVDIVKKKVMKMKY